MAFITAFIVTVVFGLIGLVIILLRLDVVFGLIGLVIILLRLETINRRVKHLEVE